MARTPPPALLYQPLPAGPGWKRTYEIQANVPIDGSRGILRDSSVGSPFTLSVIPPPLLMDAMNRERKEPIDVISASLRVNDDFTAFQEKITEFRSNGIVTKSNVQQTRLETLVGNNGIFFDPQTGQTNQANVLGIADVTQALSVISQLNALLATPPLTLLINPMAFSIVRQKKQQYSDRNRSGYIFMAWGEEQVRLNVSGRIGAYYAGTRYFDGDSPQNFQGHGGPSRGRISTTTSPSGNQFATMRDSASYQNLMSLLTLFRNNGYIYDLVGESEAHWWIGMIAISYDQWTYAGHFENFSFTHQETTMRGGIEFTFDFVASFVFDNAQRNFQVLPIRAPTPSPSDPLWSDPTKRPLPIGTTRGRLQPAPRLNPPLSPMADPLRAPLLR